MFKKSFLVCFFLYATILIVNLSLAQTSKISDRPNRSMPWFPLLLTDERLFAGTYNFYEQYDLNISNGVTLGVGSVNFLITQTNSNNLNIQGTVTNPDEGTFSFQIPLVIINSMTATLTSHPYNIGDGNILEFLLLSDGNNMVYTAIGQENDNPSDISLSVANWLKNPKSVTTDSFIGTWSGTNYCDPNLRNTTDGFEASNESGDISKVDDDSISMNFGGETVLFDVVDNRATLANAPVTINGAVYHAISIVTDGSGLSWHMVVTEENDPADVSVTIGLMTKQ